ncbi:MAG: ATP-dependent zinc metalloprotease FtsH [Kiritimatiellia bacterium]
MTQESKPPNDPNLPDPKLPNRSVIAWALVLTIVVLSLYTIVPPQRLVQVVPMSSFPELMKEGKILKAEVVPNEGYIKGELAEIDERTHKNKLFRVEVVMSDELIADLQKYGVNYSVSRQDGVLRAVLVNTVPFLLLFAVVYFLFIRQMRMAGKGAMSFGKSRAKLLQRSKNRVTFKDVAGANEAREETQEIIDFLKDPKRFQRLGGRIPKGVLLVGPPGTGKTLIAKAIAGEAEVPFFSISGSDFVEMFVGVGASRVRDMFEQARKNAPCIIFIDEIDAVGRSRFSGIGGGHDEREQTLNALLVEMDGFDTAEGIIIIAATNRPDVLDTALLRPGRFDRQIMVDLPGVDGRHDILKIHSKKVKLGPQVDLSQAARGTPGFSGADLANLINEAALLAARRNAEFVEQQDLDEARDKVRFGVERKSRVMDTHERTLTAYHEAGHAIVLEVLEHAEPVHKVTIIPRGASLGSTMQLPLKEQFTQSKRKLEAMLVGLMGGRAAEELAMDDITTGASNDLKQATKIARAMVCQFGMSKVMGPQFFGANEEQMFLGREISKTESVSEETYEQIDKEVGTMLRNAYDESLNILRQKRAELDTMARILLERETINGQDVREIVKFNRLLTPEERLREYPELTPPPPPSPTQSSARSTSSGDVSEQGTPGFSAPPKASPA